MIPYLYTTVATLAVDGKEVDRVSIRFRGQGFFVDPNQGFFLNYTAILDAIPYS